ncbi:peptidoglycan DD-metalloendopeptidase family protein [Lysobacter sp. Root494]|uniref:peptidoglycan DD-metalloendopeptidase family protein n=1 Tax=Lysobacter sp. Root494 TaxID=1736549 RepID=UPI000A4407DF|nr:peptidoglycan DD-metalloendopeptidase family protein [Lysobacter sp. Root494]
MTNTKRIVLVGIAVAALAACTSTVVRRTGTASASTSAPAPVSTPKYGATAQVQRGDTLYGIAFRNGVDVRDLAEWNSLSAPYTIYPGQRLRLYPRHAAGTAARPVAIETRPSSSSPATTATPDAAATATKPPATAPATATPATATATKPAPVASAPASDIRWRWPAEGALLSRFVGGEPTKQGVDIAGASGASVKAAADGVVVYSGSGLVGYGELVIIKHNEGWLSAYGHNRARLVNEGAIVKAGQQIAVMGRTGAPRDMLHFEIRYNGKPVDPLLYLPKR